MKKTSGANMKPAPGGRPSADARPETKNEGEGSREADRHYREGVAQHIKSGRSGEAAQEAKRALEGDEADELERAEQEAKQRADAHPNVDSPVNHDPD